MSRPINHPPRYTVQDSLGGTDERRDELIDGAVWRMAPASVLLQQSIAGSPHAQRYNQLVDKARTVADHPALVFAAPVDVVPGPSTVVQPDVVLVCDPAKLANGRYVDGAPELVLEVLSSSTARRDRLVKRDPLRAGGCGPLRHRRPRGGDLGVLLAQRRPLWQAGRLRTGGGPRPAL